ncbi:FecR family protein [Sphingobacterium hungaricum]
MHKEPFQLSDILFKYLSGECTDVELDILHNWINKDPRNKELFQKLISNPQNTEEVEFFDKLDVDRSLEEFKSKNDRKNRFKTIWINIAASILILFGLSFFYYQNQQQNTYSNNSLQSNTKKKVDVSPANIGARLTLADGKEFVIEDEIILGSNGEITSKNGENIVENAALESEEALIYNILEVPKANFFKMQLPDGTHVWINAMSSVKFPAKFSKSERRVFLDGEAYFEVAKDATKPFIVEVNGKEVKVLGTHFNIKSYHNSFKTTLVEGSVRVSFHGLTEKLAPGNYAAWRNNNFVIDKADLQKEIAWKNNEFYFKNDNIVQIANQLMMWYDLDIKLASSVSKSKTYSGSINRNVNLSEVLSMLEFVGDFKFLTNGKELTIKSK